MKNITFCIVTFLALTTASCNKAPKALSKEQVRLKTDSLVRMQVQQSNDNAYRDLERRKRIEVKVKADSILYKKLHPNDTVVNAHNTHTFTAQPK